jgi:hypothetical protein
MSDYNGWKNNETWAVNLWLTNDEASESEVRRLTADADDLAGLSASLKDYVEEGAPDLGPCLYSDLLGAALSEVDWYEIAEHYWEDFRDKDEDDAEKEC